MKILTAAQMRRVDELSTRAYKIPSLLLMENAAVQVVSVLGARRKSLEGERIAIVCGKGNNGGDGLAVARQLLMRNIHPDIYLLAPADAVAGDARTYLDVVRAMEAEAVVELPDEKSWDKRAPLAGGYDVIVDALLGTGISRPVTGYLARVIEQINASGAYVCSIDIPSGMLADELVGGVPTVRASLTVTFTAPKIAQILGRDFGRTGELVTVPIGSPRELVETDEHALNLLSAEDVQLVLRPRPAYSHKGDYGRILVVAGGRGKTGAAALAGMGALRAGAGLVTVATPASCLALVAAHRPELMTLPLAETEHQTVAARAGAELLTLLPDFDVAVVGPGLGSDAETIEFVGDLVAHSPVPLVVDADGLNAFSGQVGRLENQRRSALVLTPHPGELARLLAMPVDKLLVDRLNVVAKLAASTRQHVVLKGFRSLVAAPDGQVFVNTTGNAGMATAGTGDVLAGMVAAFLVPRHGRQGPLETSEISRAVSAAVYLHGRAGDLARDDIGEESLTAFDLLEYLGDAFGELK